MFPQASPNSPQSLSRSPMKKLINHGVFFTHILSTDTIPTKHFAILSCVKNHWHFHFSQLRISYLNYPSLQFYHDATLKPHLVLYAFWITMTRSSRFPNDILNFYCTIIRFGTIHSNKNNGRIFSTDSTLL